MLLISQLNGEIKCIPTRDSWCESRILGLVLKVQLGKGSEGGAFLLVHCVDLGFLRRIILVMVISENKQARPYSGLYAG